MTRLSVVRISPPFIDTTIFIAAAFPKEKHHKEGSAVVTSIERGELGKPVITDYVLDEVVTFVRKRKSVEASIEMMDAMLYSPNFRLVKVDNRIFESGIQLFRTYDRLSFTDAVSVATMRDLEIEVIYSFDSGFDGVPGVTRLTAIESSKKHQS